MKTKLSKILGVGLALLMVFGLAFALVPTRQAEAQLSTSPNQWQAQSIPGVATNSLYAGDVSGLVVANDGVTMYAINTVGAGAILKSTSAGMIWVALAAIGGAYVGPPKFIAIAPDNPNVIAVVDSSAATATAAAGTVYISTNGGTSFAALTAVPAALSAATADNVTSVAVGPTRAACLLGRDFAVTVADSRNGPVDGGDVYYCGFTTTWTSCAAGSAADNLTANQFDFTSAVFTPGFAGDRCLVAVGSDNTVGPFGGDTALFVIQTSDVAPVAQVLNPPNYINLQVTGTDSPGDFGTGANNIVTSSVALPSDYDPTTPASGLRTYVSWTRNTFSAADDDVYRVDFQTVRKLQTGSTSGIWSMGYSGVITGGTLIAGEAAVSAVNTTLVWATTDPQLAQPSWSASAKAPTGTANCVVQLVSPTLCYAGTSGVESAFSVSNNGGASFNQRGLINTSIDCIQDIMVSPDGKTVFMATADNGTVTGTGSGSDDESLWKCATPVTGYTWERVRITPLGADWTDVPGATIVRLSPDYVTDSVLYWCCRDGATTVNAFQRSATGGDIFSNRTAPAVIGDVAVENANALYFSQAIPSANMYSSTNGAWTFGLPVATALAPIDNLAMCPSYPEKPEPGNLLAGTVGGLVGLSLDGAASWIPLLPGIPGGATLKVLASPDWANKKIVYAGDSTVTSGIWRYEFPVSNAWEQIVAATAGAPIAGLAMAGGTLYGSENILAQRQLYPTLGVADMNGLGWDTMNVGLAGRILNSPPSALRAVVRDGEVNLWAIDTTGNNVTGGGTLMAYDDTMAITTITPTIPATVAYDPNSQGNAQFTITWPQLSNATVYDLPIFSDPGCTQLATAAFFNTPAIVAGAPALVVPSLTAGLRPGQDYYVLLRARNQVPGDAIFSRYDFANPVKFSVEIGVPISAPGVGPVLTAPQSGAVDVDPSAVNFTWGSMLSATEYEFILATDSALQNTIGGTPAYVSTPSFGPVTLDAGQSYFFAVKVTKPSVSPQSIGSFTTTGAVTVWTDPATGLTYPTREALEAALAARKAQATPLYIWIVIAVGAILVIAVIWLIFTTRKT